MREAKKDELNEKLRLSEKVGYGMGEIGAAVSGVLAAFITMYYTDNAGISLTAAGMILLVSKIFDGISDLLAGALVDHTRTRWGKARPWLLWLCVPSGITFALIFMVPQNAGQTGKIIYAFLTYNLFSTVVYTIIGVAKNALLPRITMNSEERGQLSMYGTLVGLIGAMVGISITFPLMNKFGGGTQGWRIVFSLYGLVMAIGFAVCFFCTKERVMDVEIEKEQAGKNDKTSFRESLYMFVHNKYFLLSLGLYVLLQFSTQISGSAGTYFYTYVLEDQDLMSKMTMVSMVPTVISLFFLVTPCLRYLGKRKSLFLGAGLSFVACILKLISGISGNIPLLYAGMIINGFASGPLNVPIVLVLADAIDFGDYKFGKRIEGVGSSIMTFGQKIAVGLTSYMITAILSLTGYIAGAAQTASTKMGIMFLFAIFPAIIAFLIFLLTCVFYDYEKVEPKVRAKITGAEKDGQSS